MRLCIAPSAVRLRTAGPSYAPGGGGAHYLFDSHARPELGLQGACVWAAPSRGALVERLDAMYPRHDLGAEFEADALAFTFNAFDATAVQLTTAAPPSDP